MKYSLLLLLIAVTCAGYGQSKYKQMDGFPNVYYNNNEMIIDSIKIQKGDTLFLGFGSGANKQFVFLHVAPKLLTYDVNKGPEPLPASASNGFLIVHEMKIKKVFKKEYPNPVFKLGNTNLEVMVDLKNGLLSGEVKKVSCEIIDPSTLNKGN